MYIYVVTRVGGTQPPPYPLPLFRLEKRHPERFRSLSRSSAVAVVHIWAGREGASQRLFTRGAKEVSHADGNLTSPFLSREENKEETCHHRAAHQHRGAGGYGKWRDLRTPLKCEYSLFFSFEVLRLLVFSLAC